MQRAKIQLDIGIDLDFETIRFLVLFLIPLHNSFFSFQSDNEHFFNILQGVEISHKTVYLSYLPLAHVFERMIQVS